MALRTILTALSAKVRITPIIGFHFKKPFCQGYVLLLPCSCAISGSTSIVTTTGILAARKSKNERGDTFDNIEDDKGSTKTKIISSLNFKCPEDAAPFYTLPISTLYHIQKSTLSDVRNGYCENRLYYISSKMQCQPAVVSNKLAKRTFVYDLSFPWMEKALSELLEKGVSGERILRDLWVLRYHPKTISERLQRIKDSGVDNLYPWMVRCSPAILNRYLKLTQETKSILGESSSTQMYIANRLNISIEEVQELCIKMPAFKTIRATKVKHFLDFLTEEGFDIKQIAEKPRILASSQKTVKKRLEQLRQLGVKEINLNILCRSKKDFKRICEAMAAKDGT